MRKQQKKMLLLCSVLIILIIGSLLIGVSTMKLSELFSVLLGKGTKVHEAIIFNIRLPRILMAIIVGVSLATASLILQRITKNDLAESGVLGINAGAGGMIVLSLFLFGTGIFSSFILPVLTFIGAILTTVIMYVFVFQKGKAVNGTKLLLTGVGINTALTSLTLMLSLKVPYDQFRVISIWLVGNIGNTSWWLVSVLAVIVILVFIFIYGKYRELNIFGLSSELTISMGVNEQRVKQQLLFCVALLSGCAVAGGGNILFVGLLAAHIGKMLFGGNQKYTLMASALIGAILMLFADTIGRTVFQPLEIPVGLLVGILGAPGFLLLFIQKSRRKFEG